MTIRMASVITAGLPASLQMPMRMVFVMAADSTGTAWILYAAMDMWMPTRTESAIIVILADTPVRLYIQIPLTTIPEAGRTGEDITEGITGADMDPITAVQAGTADSA